MSFIVLLGIWLSCMKATLKGKGFVDNIEIDGGGFMNAGLVTYMWVQMGFPMGVAGVRSRITALNKQLKGKGSTLINGITPRGRTSEPHLDKYHVAKESTYSRLDFWPHSLYTEYTI